jgi:hypothetical protein
MLVAADLGPAQQHALISLLALNGLRVSEATGASIEALGTERTARAIDLASGERCEGPIFVIPDGRALMAGSLHRSHTKTLPSRITCENPWPLARSSAWRRPGAWSSSTAMTSSR